MVRHWFAEPQFGLAPERGAERRRGCDDGIVVVIFAIAKFAG